MIQTADMAFSLLPSSARRVCEGNIIARDPNTTTFDMNWFGHQVTGATLGIVGMGNIGIKIAERALGFRMKILYNKRRRQEEDVEKALSAEYFASLHEMLPQCDFCCPSDPRVKGELQDVLYKRVWSYEEDGYICEYRERECC